MRFRKVRWGYVATRESAKRLLMCGDFMRLDSAWSRFATVETDPDEQLLGAQAVGICGEASIVWEDEEDLSGRRQKAFDALRDQPHRRAL